MHAWREEVFRLLGDCVGVSMEVDQWTISKEILTHGRVKVMLNKVKKLPIKIPLSLGSTCGLLQQKIEDLTAIQGQSRLTRLPLLLLESIPRLS